MSFAVSGAVTASLPDPAAQQAGNLRKLLLVALAVTFAATLLAIAPPAPVAAAGGQASKIVYYSKSHLGKRYQYGAIGLRTFDCSGLVYRVFRQASLLTKIGGGRKTASGYWRWFRERGRAGTKSPRVGDLIIWGRGKHIGIYVGSGYAISTLLSGVKKHRVHGLTSSVTAYLYVNITR